MVLSRSDFFGYRRTNPLTPRAVFRQRLYPEQAEAHAMDKSVTRTEHTAPWPDSTRPVSANPASPSFTETGLHVGIEQTVQDPVPGPDTPLPETVAEESRSRRPASPS